MRIKKFLAGLTLGAMVLSSTAVYAAETSTDSIYEADQTKPVTVTRMDVCDDGRFILYGCGDFLQETYETTEIFGAYVSGGTWKKAQKGWWYQFSDGTYPRNASIIIRNQNTYPGSNFNSITSWDQFTKYNNDPTANRKYRIEVGLDGTVYASEMSTGSWIVGDKFADTIYTFDKNGYMVTSQFVNGHWIDKNGKMRIETGKYGKWIKSAKGWWYKTEDGSYLADGFFKIYSNGLAIRNGEFTGLYYFDKNGYLAQNEFVYSPNETFTWNGTATSGLYYWANKSGLCDKNDVYGWQSNKTGKWFGEYPDGWYAKNARYRIDGTWYSFNEYGYEANSLKTAATNSKSTSKSGETSKKETHSYSTTTGKAGAPTWDASSSVSHGQSTSYTVQTSK